MKFVLLLLAVLLLLWMLFGRSRRGGTDRAPRRGEAPHGHTEPEGMVACAHCGVHLPRSEALSAGRLSYCSPAHRDAGPREDGT